MRQVVSVFFLKLSLLILAGSGNTYAQSADSSNKSQAKIPKHYFKSNVFLDGYGFGSRKIRQTDAVSERLKEYGWSQSMLGFYFPFKTIDFKSKNEYKKNLHLLFSGSFLNAKPVFSGIAQHQLIRSSLGVRAVYSDGNKVVLYYDVHPFVAQDVSSKTTTVFRWSSSIIYSYSFNETFTMRMGVTRTFLWGDRYHLPYVGLRIGRLDRNYFSIQFPRNITYSFKMGQKCRGTIFMAPRGSVFTMANNDSIYAGIDQSFIFGRSEFNSGFRLDVRLKKGFLLYLANGFVTRKEIRFSSYQNNQNNLKILTPFYSNPNLAGSIFINVGLNYQFGKARKIYNNKNIYEAIDLNSHDGLDGSSNGNAQIPVEEISEKKHLLQVQDISDLIELQDLD